MNHSNISIPYVEPSAPPPQKEYLPTSKKYTHLYKSILTQISNHLTNNYQYIVSEWTITNSNYCETYIWNKSSVFLGKVIIVFLQNLNDTILSHTMNITINTYHENIVNGWVFTKNTEDNTYSYKIKYTLNENYSLVYIYRDIYKIITPIYLLPKKKMTFWNLLDGSYFVSKFQI